MFHRKLGVVINAFVSNVASKTLWDCNFEVYSVRVLSPVQTLLVFALNAYTTSIPKSIDPKGFQSRSSQFDAWRWRHKVSKGVSAKELQQLTDVANFQVFT